MRLLALRAKRFRRFADAVALENFDAGLNIVAGANESGKSTLFGALEAAFLVPHIRTGAALELMRPRSGGEPLVEADFETKGRRYRIRKQFGRGKAAILTDLDSARVLARAAEAEAALATLIGASSEGPGRVGLVWVRQQRALLAPDPDLDPESGKPKVRGERTALMGLLGEAVVDAAGSETAEEVLSRLDDALKELVTNARGEVRKNGPLDLALRARAAAEDAAAKARQAVTASETRLGKIAALADRLEAPAARERARTESEGLALAERALSDAAETRARRDAAAAEREARRFEAENAMQAVQTREQALARRRDVQSRLDAARALEGDIRTLADALNGDPATPARLKRLGELEHALEVAEVQALGTSTAVDIELLPQGEKHVTVDGARARAHYEVSERLTIAIEDVGQIRVTAAGADLARSARARRDDLSGALTRTLAEMGAASVADAKAKAEQRQLRLTALDQARARLSALAPAGSGALENDLALLAVPSVPNEVEAARQRAGELALVARVAEKAYEDMRAAAPDDQAVRALSAKAEDLRRQVKGRLEDEQRLRIELERLKGEQSGFDEEGRVQGLARAEGELERASAEVERIEREVAALRLLQATLKSATDAIRSRYFDPVARAISPYLLKLFPEAAVDIEEGFALRALTRAGEREEYSELSDGTREQLAVLVRMGYARVLAEKGGPVPLVLDDPLVYSDDDRLAAMVGALEDAGRRFQVILLTCRMRAFEKLSGRRLALETWRPEE